MHTDPDLEAEIDQLLAGHTAEIRATVVALRALLHEAAPAATASVKRGWHSIAYHHPLAGYFCGIFPRAHEVQLLFEFGVLLPDPAGLLRGDGAQVRYVPLRIPGEIEPKPLLELLYAALALPRSRTARLGLMGRL